MASIRLPRRPTSRSKRGHSCWIAGSSSRARSSITVRPTLRVRVGPESNRTSATDLTVATVRRYDGCGCCILSGMEDPFDFQALRIHQPGKLLPDRAKYEIFNADRRLLAVVTETGGHTQ